MEYKIGRSNQRQAKDAVNEAVRGFGKPKLILAFSGVDQFEECHKELAARFPDSVVMGASTYVGLCADGAFKNQLLVLAIEDGIDCYADVLEDADKYPLRYVNRVKQCVNKLGNTQNSVCIEFSSAFLGCEESVLATLNSVLQGKNIPLLGGTAGDDCSGKRTFVALNGRVWQNAAVFVLLRNKGGKIHFYRENIYCPTKHQFVATKVDIEKRIVYEYNRRPAAQCVAEALNTTVDGLSKYLDSYPMGRLVGDEMYITANCAVAERQGMMYHARVYNDARMALLEPRDYKEIVRQTRQQIQKDVKGKTLTIMVHCLARSLLFEGDGYLDTFAKETGREIGAYIGFSGYGEQLNQQHFNQTMALAVFE